MAEQSKRATFQLEKEDRISGLPDSLIQHILSLLPSTKEAIQTSILSKRWHNQWTQVPSLFFSKYDMSNEIYSRFIDNTLLLHDCSRIKKFHIQSKGYDVWDDPHFNSKLRFAVRKGVEELFLEFEETHIEFRLPDFVLNYASLVKLELFNCEITPNGGVSWEQLKELNMELSALSNVALESILIGSPSLESLRLIVCRGLSKPAITSKSLKNMLLQFDLEDSKQVIEIRMSCPKLEELMLYGCGKIGIGSNDLSSLICATLDFDVDEQSLVEILQQVQHVKELIFGRIFIQGLAKLADIAYQCSLLLNIKCLTLDYPEFGKHPYGIAYALGIFPLLEKLVIRDPIYETADFSTKYWDSMSLVSNLRTVHIVGLGKRCIVGIGKISKCDVPLDFVDFLMKNAPQMQKLVMLKDR